ncbi:Gfo/Idh/MocA family protein [Candidatus Poriferisodalis sp.]|uniref:Gfo/Idh/MocA family protein n=1 Tax=Candidatus Poriferisodalis sp. TaxID=3101277 RepID=UPI003B012B10
MRRRLGIAVVGFGWMGQAHARSVMRIPSLFDDRSYAPELVVCADTVDERRTTAREGFGFGDTIEDWRAAVDRPDVDVVYVTAPNMLHEEIVSAATGAGKHVFCEKPVGGTPAQAVRCLEAAKTAGSITGVGFNYRFAPLVQHVKTLIDSGALGSITNYRGRFFSMFGADPLGLLSWRFELDQAGHGVTSDILSHAVDLAMMLNGPIIRVIGSGATFIAERPIATVGASHYARGRPGDPTGPVTNEDYFGALAVFANGSRGTFEVSRTMVGPESQMAFDIYGTEGAANWNLETMNELGLYLAPKAGSTAERGYTTVRAGERHPGHRAFVPGDANAIGFEDLVALEDHQYLSAVSAGRPHAAGFAEAVAYVSVQAALLRSWVSGAWEDVIPLTTGNVDELAPHDPAGLTSR